MERGEANVQGEIAQRFVLKRELAKRSSSTVYVAADNQLQGLEVVVKIFNQGPGGDQALSNEFDQTVQKLRAASHPVLVPLLAGGVHEGRFFVALEFVRGESLRDILSQRKGPLDIATAVQCVVALAEGLQELQNQGLVHGHLDSRAVLFRDGEPRLAGFCPEVIQKIQRNITSGAPMIGEPAYLTPEQVTGSAPLSHLSDMYALSVLMFEMVTGSRPFSGSNPMQTAMLHVSQPVPSPRKLNPNVTPLLDAAIQKGLAKEPKERFQNFRDFIGAVLVGFAPREPQAVYAESSDTTQTLTFTLTPEERQRLFQPPPEKAPTPSPKPESSVEMTMVGMKAVKLPPQDAPSSPTPIATSASAGRLQGTETVMGMKALDILPASIMFLTGARRGERIMLEKPQMILGADPACDLVVGGKKVPPRYALLVRRGEGYGLASLSSSPVRLNDGQVEPEREHLLQRGDVIRVGEEEIRFIAPGEVFTLRENVADRVVDRPKSRVPVVIAASLVVGIVVLGGGAYVYHQQSESALRAQQAAKASQDAEREAVMKRLIREGDEFYKAGALTFPVGANAEERFRQVLELKPDHAYAKSRLAEIDSRLKNLAEDRLRQDQLSQRIQQALNDGEQYFQARALIAPPGKNARELFEQVLKLDPKNEKATARIQEINTLLSDQLNRVRDTIAAAKAHIAEGRFAQPPGQNAFELLKTVFEVDPKNGEAREMLYDMAAKSLFEGDRAKARAESIPMKQAYLTAKVLGVDPQVIKERLKGADLMKKSRSSVIIVDAAKQSEKVETSPAGGNFLDMNELERRIAALTLAEEEGQGAKTRRFIDLKQE